MTKLLELILLINIFVLLISIAVNRVEKAKKTSDLPPHHTSKGFRNPHTQIDRGFADFLRWRFKRGPVESPSISLEEIPNYQPQFSKPDLLRIQNPDSSQVQVTWIGHATLLVQVDGVNILTDPIFSDRCSPVSFAGPKRIAKPGVDFDALPEIHAVVISHNHYDHLDEGTVERLANSPKYFVPLGLADWFRKKKMDNVLELDWWQFHEFAGLKFNAVPSQHFSGRSFFDRNETLWCGWIIESRAGNIFFAGDTGYSPDFLEIGNRFRPIKVSMIPIGAYKPRWFMGPVHVDPPQAIRIHQDVQSENSIAMHWGTFKLSDEPLGEPPVYLRKALAEADIDGEFRVMKFGETLSFK